MPLLDEAVHWTLALDVESVKLTRETHREIGDVDHLLNFALTLRKNFSDLKCHQLSERFFLIAKQITELADDLTTLWSRNHAPLVVCSHGLIDDRIVFSFSRHLYASDNLPIYR